MAPGGDVGPEGWDFSGLPGRMREDASPWDFDAVCRAGIGRSRHLLDMGTGGGEQLLRFADVLPADTTATEGWAPNVPVATRNLESPGIPVVDWDADRQPPVGMPFEDGRFDLVVNRHEAFGAPEVVRVLSPGGVFLGVGPPSGLHRCSACRSAEATARADPER